MARGGIRARRARLVSHCRTASVGGPKRRAGRCGRIGQILRVDLLYEHRQLVSFRLSVSQSAVAVGDDYALLSTGEGYVEQAPFLFEVARGAHHRQRGEEVRFHSGDDYIREFQTLGRMDGHKCHLVVFVSVGGGIGI